MGMNYELSTILFFSITFFIATLIQIIFLIETNNLFLIFVLLETQSFGFYILTAIKINKIGSTEAALKYLAFGALTTSFYILGLSLIYQNSGTINLPLTNLNSSGELGIIIITIVFFGKLGLIPLHH